MVVGFDRETITPLIVEGLADLGTERPVEANDPVRIASISKLIMALTALRLMDEGKVDLDRDVSLYLGWRLVHPQFPAQKITLRLLLSHQSGLKDDAGYFIPLDAKLADLLAWKFHFVHCGAPCA